MSTCVIGQELKRRYVCIRRVSVCIDGQFLAYSCFWATSQLCVCCLGGGGAIVGRRGLSLGRLGGLSVHTGFLLGLRRGVERGHRSKSAPLVLLICRKGLIALQVDHKWSSSCKSYIENSRIVSRAGRVTVTTSILNHFKARKMHLWPHL